MPVHKIQSLTLTIIGIALGELDRSFRCHEDIYGLRANVLPARVYTNDENICTDTMVR